MRWIACFVFVASLCAGRDSHAQSPAPVTDRASARVWSGGLRAGLGFAYATHAHLCLFSRSDACADDHASYVLVGGEVYGALGRPRSLWRWKPSLDFDVGVGNGSAFGQVVAIRALSSAQLLSDPTESGGFLFEIGGGLGYDAFGRTSNASSPMVALAAALGGRFNRVEVLVRGQVDAFVFTSVAGVSLRAGYAF